MPRHTTVPVFAGLLCIAAAGLVLAAVPSPAAACVCGPKTDEEVIRSMPIILTGRVTEVRRPPGLGQVTATIEVLERWKGEVPDRVSVHGWISNNSCEMDVPFSLGATMVFLVRPSRTGDDFRVGDMCSTYRAGLPGRPVPASFAAALARHRAERQRVDRAAAAAPGSASALLDKARFLETDQQLPDAIALYAEAARLAPDLPAAHLGEGRALFASKLFDAAQPPLRRALELQPGDPEAARLLDRPASTPATCPSWTPSTSGDWTRGAWTCRGATCAGGTFPVPASTAGCSPAPTSAERDSPRRTSPAVPLRGRTSAA